MAEECRVFGVNSATEFHKLRHRIWQNLPRKNGGPASQPSFAEMTLIHKMITSYNWLLKYLVQQCTDY